MFRRVMKELLGPGESVPGMVVGQRGPGLTGQVIRNVVDHARLTAAQGIQHELVAAINDLTGPFGRPTGIIRIENQAGRPEEMMAGPTPRARWLSPGEATVAGGSEKRRRGKKKKQGNPVKGRRVFGGGSRGRTSPGTGTEEDGTVFEASQGPDGVWEVTNE